MNWKHVSITSLNVPIRQIINLVHIFTVYNVILKKNSGVQCSNKISYAAANDDLFFVKIN